MASWHHVESLHVGDAVSTNFHNCGKGVLTMSMAYEEITQTIKGLRDLIPLVKQFNITTRTKAEHRTKLEEARKLLYECQKVHFMYDPEYNVGFNFYRQGITMWETKKKLDQHLNYFIISLRDDIKRHIVELEKLKDNLI